MDTIHQKQANSKKYTRLAAGAVAAFGLLCITGRAISDPPETMAPPIQAGADAPYSDQGDSDAFHGGEAPVTEAPPVDNGDGASESSYQSSPNTSENSVFKWTEIPENQRVPLTRAVFDQGGYQLYDTAGETVVVPFTDHNLYVMKFAVSPDDTMFFVNTGNAPVLYVPENGYLENASVPGAKWYPFSEKFHPETPVFYGIAPSYDDYVDIGWYPDTVFYGGYYGHTSFIEGGVFLPSFGLSIFIGGGHSFYGWGGYRSYVYDHPAPYHIGYFNRGVYRFAGGPGYGHPFRGGYASGYHSGFNHGFANGYHSGFNGAGREFQGGRSFNGGTTHSLNGSGFRGGSTAFAHRSFQGSREEFNGGSGSFSQGRSFNGGGNTGGRTFNGGGNNGGSRTFNGGGNNGGSRTFNGGGNNGGGRTFNGGGNNGGGRTFNGGGSFHSNSVGGGGFRGGSGGGGFHGGGGGGNHGGR